MPTSSTLPVHLITGLLGSGKTTTLKNLIAQKPADEIWGIIINEFGEVDIDASSLAQDPMTPIISVAGGCVCCNAQLGLSQAVNELLSLPAPLQINRLWIEPTGLGHPAKIIDTLRHTPFVRPLQLQKIICVVTAKQLTATRWQKSAVMRDLITLADTLILNKMDQNAADEVADSLALLHGLYPPKTAVLATRNGEVTLADILGKSPPPTFTLLAERSDTATHHRNVAYQSYPINSLLAKVSTCIAQTNPQNNQLKSIGWIFDPSVQFNRVLLKQFFAEFSPYLQRGKGILKTGLAWQLVNWVENELTFAEIGWRQDSRLELIFHDDMLTHSLLANALAEGACPAEITVRFIESHLNRAIHQPAENKAP